MRRLWRMASFTSQVCLTEFCHNTRYHRLTMRNFEKNKNEIIFYK